MAVLAICIDEELNAVPLMKSKQMTLLPCVFPPGLAVGLGIGALAEVAKKSIRHNGAAGNSDDFIFAALA